MTERGPLARAHDDAYSVGVEWELARLGPVDPDDPPLCEAERCTGLEHPAGYIVRMPRLDLADLPLSAVPSEPAFRFYACQECVDLLRAGTR